MFSVLLWLQILVIMETKAGKEQLAGYRDIEKVTRVLISKGFRTIVLNSEKEVKDFINSKIPDEQIVGLGDSITTCKLNIRHLLAAKGSIIFYAWNGTENYNRSLDTFEPLPRPDYYLTRINAVTVNGEILLKDYAKECVSEDLLPRHIFAFAGLNRIVKTFNGTEGKLRYPVFDKAFPGIEFTVALLPFMIY